MRAFIDRVLGKRAGKLPSFTAVFANETSDDVMFKVKTINSTLIIMFGGLILFCFGYRRLREWLAPLDGQRLLKISGSIRSPLARSAVHVPIIM